MTVSNLTGHLEGILLQLEEAWQPFAHPKQTEWISPQGLAALIEARDASLIAATPLVAELQVNWKLWEGEKPDEKERARVFSVRNRLVNLALEASRFETTLEANLGKRIDETRRQASATTKRLQVATAYGRMSRH